MDKLSNRLGTFSNKANKVSVNNNKKKSFFCEKALICLSFVFCMESAFAPIYQEPFSEIFGTDLTTEEYSENGVSGIFLSESYKSVKYSYDKLEKRLKELEGNEYVNLTLNNFFNDVNNHIKKEEENKGGELYGKELAFTIDKYINNFLEYTDDIDSYGYSEYFATPYETITNKKGDCEDYAILKYATLKHFGFPESMMRLAISPNHLNLLIDVGTKMYQLDNNYPITRISTDNIFAVNTIHSLKQLNTPLNSSNKISHLINKQLI